MKPEYLEFNLLMTSKGIEVTELKQIMKKYKLLKDTSWAKTGTIYEKEPRGEQYYYVSQEHKGKEMHGYPIEFVEQTDWFEEIKEKTYIIHQIRDKINNLYTRTSLDIYSYYNRYYDKFNLYSPNFYENKIESVIRIKDNKNFKIGDYVEIYGRAGKGKIIGFQLSICQNFIWVHIENHHSKVNLEIINKTEPDFGLDEQIKYIKLCIEAGVQHFKDNKMYKIINSLQLLKFGRELRSENEFINLSNLSPHLGINTNPK